MIYGGPHVLRIDPGTSSRRAYGRVGAFLDERLQNAGLTTLR